MLFLKRWLVFAVLGFFLFLSSVSAIALVRINNSDTSIDINVTSASNLYAYEVALDYTGTPDSPTFGTFLGAGTSQGSSSRNSIFNVYESKQDGTSTGVTGSGKLFTLTFSGTVTLRYLLAVYGDGSTEYVYYNNSGSSGSTSTGSTGGGGSGGSTAQSLPPVDLNLVDILSDTPELAISTVAGRSFDREVKIRNSGTVEVTLDITYTGFKSLDVVNNITLAPGEEKTISLSFGAVDKGLITGVLSFSVQGTSVYEIPIVINTRSENFLFDSILTLSDDSKVVRPGETIRAQINLEQVAKQNEQVDVVVSYVIKDFFGATYLEESETFSIIASKDYEKEFLVPKDLEPGKYIVGIEVTYPGAFATASAQFEVPPPFWSLNAATILIVASVAMAIVFSLVIIWAIKRKKILYHKDKSKRSSR